MSTRYPVLLKPRRPGTCYPMQAVLPGGTNSSTTDGARFILVAVITVALMAAGQSLDPALDLTLQLKAASLGWL